jgi:hypothetical protein
MGSLARLIIRSSRINTIRSWLLLTFLFSPFVSSVIDAQNSVRRDQPWLNIFPKSINAPGGLPYFGLIQNFTESITATYFWKGEPSGSVTGDSWGVHFERR